jgi:hypothetical protein
MALQCRQFAASLRNIKVRLRGGSFGEKAPAE